MTDTVTIPLREYEEMLRGLAILNALRSAGVDNWDGYDYALEMLDEAD